MLQSRVRFDDIYEDTFVAGHSVPEVLSDDVDESVAIVIWCWHVNLGEARSKVGWEVLLSDIGRRVHTSEEPEVGMTRYGLDVSSLSENHRGGRSLKDGRDRFEGFVRCEIDLVEQ